MFYFQCINHSSVVKIINDFDSNKAQGYDKMPMQKWAKLDCFSCCKNDEWIHEQMCFPDNLKFAEVSALFSQKDSLFETNYRPVCILVALSKIC